MNAFSQNSNKNWEDCELSIRLDEIVETKGYFEIISEKVYQKKKSCI